MGTPSSGQIAISDLISNQGNMGYGNSLYWLDINTKDSVSDLNSAHARSPYQRNMDGNCNNGNCTQSDCNCGNKNCPNCLNCGAINCANCDTRQWLQADCNCNCTYNCTQSTHSFNCDCDCFVCACACW